jgi:PilZ domain-containing protein
MGVLEEQRRAPRTVVDVEALLHLNGLRSFPGVIHDMAYLGCLFVPDKPLVVAPGDRGSMRFAMPMVDQWLAPTVEVRRLTSFTRLGGDVGQGIGLEFSGLKQQEEQAITAGCQQWDSYRTRRYELTARCYVESEGGSTHYARFGELRGGTRNYLRLNLPAGAGLARGIRLRLKMARTWVAGEVEQTTVKSTDMEVLVRIEGWGRDFFLHEARRQSLQ